MGSLTVRVSQSTHAILQELAAQSDTTIAQVVDEAAHELKRKRFWADYHASYATLKADPEAWADFQDESAAWDATLNDGLDVRSEETQGSVDDSETR